jgi:formate hydrogenlyase subunit 3/multisubunit Na+/H+ antiporter MnhD subunit
MTINLIFVCLFIGFGMKAGIIPLHKWLPYAHPASPSNISALMSGVMIKVAIYGLMRFIIYVLDPSLWWGILILVFGALSAILGVIYAMKEHDIKRLLAYHSIENIGIILIGFGLYVVFSFNGFQELATLSLFGSLLHTLNHAVFKSLLFMSAGSIVNATGTRNIESMGGLIHRMPYTAVIFLVGAVSISALPPFNGFVSELMIFQALMQSHVLVDPLLKVLMILCLSVFALTSALAAACFVKAFGITFLAVSRSENARRASEVSTLMILGPGILAIVCLILGIFPGWILSTAGYTLGIPNMLSVGAVLIISSAAVFVAVHFNSSHKSRIGETWGCGIVSQNCRMEYTASGFSEPIMTIFKPIYHTEKSVHRTFFDRYGSVFKEGDAEIHLIKFFEQYLYLPVADAVDSIAVRVSSMQNGHLDSYLSYAFVTVLALLVVMGWFL